MSQLALELCRLEVEESVAVLVNVEGFVEAEAGLGTEALLCLGCTQHAEGVSHVVD